MTPASLRLIYPRLFSFSALGKRNDSFLKYSTTTNRDGRCRIHLEVSSLEANSVNCSNDQTIFRNIHLFFLKRSQGRRKTGNFQTMLVLKKKEKKKAEKKTRSFGTLPCDDVLANFRSNEDGRR